jgi:hypothetical protein
MFKSVNTTLHSERVRLHVSAKHKPSSGPVTRILVSRTDDGLSCLAETCSLILHMVLNSVQRQMTLLLLLPLYLLNKMETLVESEGELINILINEGMRQR